MTPYCVARRPTMARDEKETLAGYLEELPLPAFRKGYEELARQAQQESLSYEQYLLLWDAATRTQHFIRKASFHSAADDFGFLVPTPARPELEESGNEAFSFLQKLTEPEKK